MKHPLLRFILLSLLASLPVWAFVAWYVAVDPYKVIHHHAPFYSSTDVLIPSFNKSFISTDILERNYRTQHYDSFIFGSSISIYYGIDDWKKVNPSVRNAFHYDASAETIDGIMLKIQFLEKLGIKMKNALIVIDDGMLRRRPEREQFLYAQHPDLTPEWDYLQFQKLFFDIVKRRGFLMEYFNVLGAADPKKEHYFFTSDIALRNDITNEERYPHEDSLIAHDPERYYTASRLKQFDIPEQEDPTPAIDAYILQRLATIASLLNRNAVDYKVIVAPLYHGRQINKHDAEALCRLFGKERIADFSGQEKITSDARCYYDYKSHAHHLTTKSLLEQAYKAR